MDINEFYTIQQNVTTEIIEKKSRFIANIFYVENKEECEQIIKNTKKKYYDAKHNCFAFSIFDGQNILQKCSDDGEPSGTAGEPILNAIQKNNINNVLIIVTRYFGGVLLGAGGLIRAYSNSAIEAINKAGKIIKQPGMEVKIKISYEENEKFKYYCEKNNIRLLNAEYLENILYTTEISEKQFEELLKLQKENNVPKIINIEQIRIICRKYVEKQI